MERVNEQLRRELLEIVRTEIRDPRVEGVSVTEVDTARDLTFARVFVRLTGSDAARAQALEGLTAAAGFARRRLAELLPLRRTPELRFVEDRTALQADRIDRLLAEMEIPPPEDEDLEGEDLERDNAEGDNMEDGDTEDGDTEDEEEPGA